MSDLRNNYSTTQTKQKKPFFRANPVMNRLSKVNDVAGTNEKAAGYGVGMVGGMVGCAIASEAYATAVEFGTENAGLLAEKAKSAAEGTIQLVKENAPERVDDVRNAVNKYAAKFNLPFSV